MLTLADPKTQSQATRHFREKARMYNALLGFGRISVGQQQPQGQGIPMCLLNGEFSHRMMDLSFANRNQPELAQLYVLDEQLALDIRRGNPIYSERKLDPMF